MNDGIGMKRKLTRLSQGIDNRRCYKRKTADDYNGVEATIALWSFRMDIDCCRRIDSVDEKRRVDVVQLVRRFSSVRSRTMLVQVLPSLTT